VHVALTQPDADWLCLRVSDRGPGVPTIYHEKIFEPFFRLPGAAEKEGAGLGLALVRSIVIRHGGRVVCEDQPGGGVSFAVWLPRTAPAAVV
jgi:two-component system OmpR family sensor kinase